MFTLPSLLVVSSTYSTHFSDSVWGHLSVRPTLRHCIRIWRNKPITVQRLIGFSNKNELNVCIWLRNVPCSKTLFLVIRLRLCLEVKVQYPIAKIQNYLFWPKLCNVKLDFIWIQQMINPDERLCRALKTECYFQGQGRTKRSTTK